MTCGRSSNGLSKIPCWMTEGHRAGGHFERYEHMVIKITLRPTGSIDSSLAVTLSLFTDRIKSKPADAFGLLYRDQPDNSCRCNQAREKGRWQCWPRSRAAYGCSIRITKMRVTRAVALTPKISASWRF